MSMEIYVMSERRLGSIAEWQQAIDAEGFDLRLDASRPFEKLSGHLPAQRGDQHAGFECDHWKPADVLEAFAECAISISAPLNAGPGVSLRRG